MSHNQSSSRILISYVIAGPIENEELKMDLKKKSRNKGRPNASNNGSNSDVIDASPDGSAPVSKGKTARGSMQPNNLRETKIWKDSVGGAQGMWNQYIAFVGKSFENLPLEKQENYILRMCQAFTIGSTVLVFSLFYYFIPTIVRIFLLPVVLIGSWWLGTNVVTPLVMARFEKYLNK